jgi:hypothetical protein
VQNERFSQRFLHFETLTHWYMYIDCLLHSLMFYCICSECPALCISFTTSMLDPIFSLLYFCKRNLYQSPSTSTYLPQISLHKTVKVPIWHRICQNMWNHSCQGPASSSCGSPSVTHRMLAVAGINDFLSFTLVNVVSVVLGP